ncbi:MAG: outer membrane protein transport protein [bacterium]|nr:outer membrane protein transport protein [bacterium]
MSYKKGLLVVGLLLGAIFSSRLVFAGGLEGPGVGTRALSMGGAFIGLADDWTAIYWNPAGLANLSGRGIGVSLDAVFSQASDGNSAGNPTLTPAGLPQEAKDRGEVFFQLGGEPNNFDKEDIESTVYLPTLGGYTHFKGFVVGGGIYEPLGYTAKWDDSKSGIDASFEIKAYEIVFNHAVAKSLTPDLSIGLGLNLLQGKVEREAKKVVPVTYPVSYTYTSKAKGDGISLEGVVGALYQISPNISAGLVYRTGSKLTLDGSTKITHTHPAIADEESDYEQKFRVPATYGLGLAYHPLSNFTLTCDWNYTDWTTFRKEIDFSDTGSILQNKDESLDWEAVSKIRLGLEYKPNNIWSFRAGFFTDPSPVPDKALNITNLGGIDTDRNFYSVGSTYNYNNWRFDLGFIHTKSDREAQGVKYEKEANSIHLASSYSF